MLVRSLHHSRSKKIKKCTIAW